MTWKTANSGTSTGVITLLNDDNKIGSSVTIALDTKPSQKGFAVFYDPGSKAQGQMKWYAIGGADNAQDMVNLIDAQDLSKQDRAVVSAAYSSAYYLFVYK